MIHAVGDSHSVYAFRDMPGVHVAKSGPVTMKRVGYIQDELTRGKVEALGLKPGDVVIFCFGEIDVRCYVKPTLERKKSLSADDLLGEWVDRYLETLTTFPLDGAKVAVMSIMPPTTRRLAESINWPVGGTDAERAEYTRIANRHLATGCAARGWTYIDVHSLYADANGMLPEKRSDGLVHIKDTKPIGKLLKEMRWL